MISFKGIVSENNENFLIFSQRPFDPKFETLRPHKIDVSFFNKDGGIEENINVQIRDAEARVKTERKDYVASLPNSQDWSFVDVQLDDKSLEFFKHNTHKIKDPLCQMVIAKCFYDMCMNRLITCNELADFMFSQYFKE